MAILPRPRPTAEASPAEESVETALDALAEPVATIAEPPRVHLTPRQWIRANLFSSYFNAVLTVVFGLFVGWALYRIAYWMLVTADWTIVRVNLRGFMIGGRFPSEQVWRLWTSLYVLTITGGVALGMMIRTNRERELESNGSTEPGPEARGPTRGARSQPGLGRLWPPVLEVLHRFWPLILAAVVVLGLIRTILPALLAAGLVAAFVVSRATGARLTIGVRWLWLIVIAGLILAFQVVSYGPSGVTWDRWGGLHLTVFATIAGIVLAFPLGLLLALGRRSSLPGFRVVAIAFIEVFRAVPLVTLLFMGDFMIGFFLPTWIDAPSRLARAIIAITLFESAYIAEIVRGGLQAVPRGQIEAAQAIGLPPTRVMRLVVLPQALRAVIPAMVGQFISLFKDTSLLAILSFPDLLRIAEVAPSADQFRGQGLKPVTLAFAGFLYWAGCITMSRESQRLERRLGVGER